MDREICSSCERYTQRTTRLAQITGKKRYTHRRLRIKGEKKLAIGRTEREYQVQLCLRVDLNGEDNSYALRSLKRFELQASKVDDLASSWPSIVRKTRRQLPAMVEIRSCEWKKGRTTWREIVEKSASSDEYARDAWRSTKKRVPLCVEIRRRRFTQSDSILSPELLPNCQSKHADGKV